MKKYYFALSQKLDPLYQIVGPPETVHLYAVVDVPRPFFFFFTLYVDKYTNKGVYIGVNAKATSLPDWFIKNPN